ncbi:alpha-aminoadipic semialdehyde synthase [Iris pallida]|uniref:Alpha-aminoadipic semialdehyde synthase n=1 Tax=Iris pallida TaxID=29817 RepID=A0AAX6F3H1_IRIPA|nr:alpha-aminoadipic semialdehyde synthase [Iris pallida]
MILYTFSISRFILYVFSLAAAKAAIIVGEEISTLGLPSGIAHVVFVFRGTGNGIYIYMAIGKERSHFGMDTNMYPLFLSVPYLVSSILLPKHRYEIVKH